MVVKQKDNETMMKNILKICGLFGVLLLLACNSEDNITAENNKVNVGKGITFQFNEEAFVPGTISKKGTRAAQTPEVIDLGNGLTAEVALEPDTLGLSQTRAASPIPDGHYKIYAIDASGTRHDGLDGNVSGGVFTPNPPGRWELNGGETYTFVCINDAVVDNGTSLSYTYSKDQTVLQPLIGVTQHQVSNMGDDVVSFVMRHQNARVRFQVTSFTAPCMNLKLQYNMDQTIAPCEVTNYDLKGVITGYTGSADTSQWGDFIPLTVNKPYVPSAITETYKTSTGYIYYPGHFQMWMQHYMWWDGTIYGKSDTFSKSIFTNLAFGHQATDFFEPNHSYVYNITVKPSVLYLFSDGTVGTLGDKGSRTPIGIVVKEKTSASDQGTACALEVIKDPVSPNPVTYGDAYAWEDETKTLPSNSDHLNTTVYNGIHDGQSDMNGYNWTWDANSTKDHVVRGEAKEKYPAFYQAGHYTPSNVTITGANIGKWYIPAAGEVVKLIQRFGAVTTPANEPWRGYSSMAQTDMDKMIAAFHAVNNTLQMDGQFFWTSTVCDAANTGFFGPYLPASFYFYSDGRTWWPTFSKAGANFYILPFVHF